MDRILSEIEANLIQAHWMRTKESLTKEYLNNNMLKCGIRVYYRVQECIPAVKIERCSACCLYRRGCLRTDAALWMI